MSRATGSSDEFQQGEVKDILISQRIYQNKDENGVFVKTRFLLKYWCIIPYINWLGVELLIYM